MEHSVFGGIPECVAELGVVLDGHWVNGAADLETALFELHDRGVVDAGALGEDQDRQLVRVLNVFPQSVY